MNIQRETQVDGGLSDRPLEQNVQEETTAFLECDTITRDDNSDKHDKKAELILLKHLGLFERLRKDQHYRKRFIHSICLFLANVSMGLNFSIIGPTFPDLRRIVEVDIGTASWLFTAFFFGYLAGSFLGGILYDRVDKLLLIFFSVFGLALTCGLLPWCDDFHLMVTVRMLTGMASGGLDTGANADMLSIWNEGGRSYMQALHLCFGIGGFIAPLIAEPYLAHNDCILATMTNSTRDNFQLYPAVVAYENISFDGSFSNFDMDNSTSFSVFDMDNANKTIDTKCIYGETNVHFAYLIIATFNFCSALPLLLLFVKSRMENKPHVVTCDQIRKARPGKLPMKLKCIFLILLSSMMLLYNAVEDTFAGFLMTFSLEHLNWDKHTGSFVSSMFWVAFSCGRVLGIFLVKWFKPVQLLFLFLLMIICSLVGLLIGSMLYLSTLVNVFVPLVGFSMSIIFPSIFSWTEESILEVTGKISSLFLISSSSGLLINPLLLGYLMKNYAPIWFVHLFLAQSVVVFGLFLTIVFLVNKLVIDINETKEENT